MIIDEKPSLKRKHVELETKMNKAGEELKFRQQKEELDEISEMVKNIIFSHSDGDMML